MSATKQASKKPTGGTEREEDPPPCSAFCGGTDYYGKLWITQCQRPMGHTGRHEAKEDESNLYWMLSFKRIDWDEPDEDEEPEGNANDKVSDGV